MSGGFDQPACNLVRRVESGAPEPLGQPRGQSFPVRLLGRGKCGKRDLDTAVLGESLPSFRIPVFALRDRHAVGDALFLKQTGKQLLRFLLIKFLQDFRCADRSSAGIRHEQAGRQVVGGRGKRSGCRHGILKVDPEESPGVSGGVEGLDHGRFTFRVCRREKRSM